MTASNVIDVHINDAPAGLSIDEQVDNVRTLPGETGVIPMTLFLQALVKMGYEGPVTPEPFSGDCTRSNPRRRFERPRTRCAKCGGPQVWTHRKGYFSDVTFLT